jgi:lipid-binding SYLF domain-containing protein
VRVIAIVDHFDPAISDQKGFRPPPGRSNTTAINRTAKLMSTRKIFPAAAFLLLAVFIMAAPAHAFIFKSEKTPDQQRAEIRAMRDQALAELYKTQPAAKGVIAKAAGYAVFSNFGMKIFMAGGGTGQGLAVANDTRKETFMKMAEVQAGLGFGVKKFRLVWVFLNKADLNNFITSGWEIGAQSTASAQMGAQGTQVYTGAVSITPGVWLYQLTDDGLAVELTAKGTKYYQNAELN